MTFPNEMLSTVLNELSPTSLAAVARVSIRFNAVAERILYGSIYVTDHLSEDSPLPLRTLWWCQAMQRRPHLFETTRKLQIKWRADSSVPPPHYLASHCDQVNEILRSLTPLESLELSLGPANLVMAHQQPIHAVERMIYGCHFSQLRTCSLGAKWTKGVPPYTEILTSFLVSLRSLRYLKLTDLHSGVVGLPPRALAQLTSFRGSADAAASLLPGRPVQYLSLTGQDSDVNRDNLPCMTYTTVPLRCLDLSAMSIRFVLLRNISTHFPAVETLRVKLGLRHTLHYSFSGINLLAGLSAVLNAFTHLSHLDLSPTGVYGFRVGQADSLEELALCQEWSRACPTLRRIVFPSQTDWILDLNNVWTTVSEA